MNAFEMRLIPAARMSDFGGPAGACPHQMVWSVRDERSPSHRPTAAAPGYRTAPRADRADRPSVEDALRRRRSHARQQLHDAKAGDPVARVLDEPQQRQQILDVRGVEELQAAELHEGNVAPCQLDFERAAVVRGPEEDRLLLQARANLAVFQHALDDVAGLVGLVAHADQPRTLGRLAVRPEVLGEALAASSITPLAAARIGCVER